MEAWLEGHVEHRSGDSEGCDGDQGRRAYSSGSLTAVVISGVNPMGARGAPAAVRADPAPPFWAQLARWGAQALLTARGRLGRGGDAPGERGHLFTADFGIDTC